eukprot:TRINITY_DN13819_c2_g2_i1.p3 TRINITY_DN13819_c2_g2~~TRINITY_DN13819_c2_g2_i1.p3  ORF type:complete len:125 (-),score=18.02 TRINITY_DN13819_c2_g2_i1:228-602(-)
MSLLSKAVNADAAGGLVWKLYEHSHVALAGLVPAAMLAPEGTWLTRFVDMGLAIAAPYHSHVACNAVISDYVPPSFRGISRNVMLGVTGVTVIGLLRLNLFGPGITDSVKVLWRNEKKVEASQS